TKIDLFAHSYGGRRFFQFAMDYPDQVRSITTIGTPYDKNTMGKLGNNVSILRWKWVQKLVDKEPTQYSGYVDPNPENRRVDKGIEHSNVYTDMTSEALSEEMTYLKAANPEVYRKLEEMDITAVAGYDLAGWLGTKSSQDGAVSVKSQQAKSLGALIDQRLSYKVDGGGFRPTKPPHIYEIENEEFIELIKKVNKTQQE
ncbi:alpha/beta hydrolase, partial [Bacillus aquiflavi]|nr:alpha/beta hydrolase [Bacillus aquiflavi]NEY83181.1 alpha/beta hydrolase [Bacillus aquiflavi]